VKQCLAWLALWAGITSTVAAQEAAEAAPPPAAATTEVEAPARPRGAPQVGLSPDTPQTGSLIANPVAEETSATGADMPSDGAWRFEFEGYLRAPMRLGFGSGPAAPPAMGEDGKIHAPAWIPDGTFTDWRYTHNIPGPWVELRFLYGNGRVTGNASIAAYNITDGSYRNLQAQLGIDQAFIKIDWSDLFEQHGGLVWNVGVFQNRYGAAGRYDAGKYDTYLIGRTHVAGETLTGFYHLNDLLTITLEHGIGAKIEAISRVGALPEPTPRHLPWAGPAQLGTQLVHHLHGMLSVGDFLNVGLHYLTTWTDDATLAGERDGRITSYGIDAKLIGSRYGDGYIGFSHVDADDIIRVGEGLELLHSISGWNVRDNFFGQQSSGSGTIDSVMFQYTLSLARYLRYPEQFWGQGPDVLLSVFGMYNHVTGREDDPMFTGASDKLKWGFEATYTMLPFLGVSARFDRVQPDLDDSTLAFSAISPRLILRSEFVTHEEILIQYTHYFYGDNVSPAWPNEAQSPDSDGLLIAAIMWW
jgi:hypothetical protein